MPELRILGRRKRERFRQLPSGTARPHKSDNVLLAPREITVYRRSPATPKRKFYMGLST